MKVNLSLSIEDAQRLRRILHDLRASLVVCENSMNWRDVGSVAPAYSLDDIILIEDLGADLIEQLEDVTQQTYFAGCCHVF